LYHRHDAIIPEIIAATANRIETNFTACPLNYIDRSTLVPLGALGHAAVHRGRSQDVPTHICTVYVERKSAS
jgi:hypothetical protein